MKTKKQKVVKGEFPKKAKLISDGGFYIILPIKEFVQQIHYPILRRIQVNQPELDYSEMWKFNLKFNFYRVYRGYAEYKQYDAVKIIYQPL